MLWTGIHLGATHTQSHFTVHNRDSWNSLTFTAKISNLKFTFNKYQSAGQKVFKSTSPKKQKLLKVQNSKSVLSPPSPQHQQQKVTTFLGPATHFSGWELTKTPRSLEFPSSWHHLQQPQFFLLNTSALSWCFKFPLSYFQQRRKRWFIIFPLMTTRSTEFFWPKRSFPTGHHLKS